MRRALRYILLALLAAAALPVRAQEPSPSNEPHAQSEAERLPPADAEPPATVRETELDRATKEVAAQLRCVVCQGLSIQDSPSSLAQEMRAVVREQLAAGKSPDEVKEYFVGKYGEWVLLQPKPQGFNLVVYLLPVAMVLGGAAFVFSKARGWTRSGESQQPLSEEEVLHR
jgi:cytochrome c-type biogenesis protein CcmH/NrfF